MVRNRDQTEQLMGGHVLISQRPIRCPIHSPSDHDNEIHDVPGVSQVAVAVEDEAQGQDLQGRLHREDGQEVGFGLLLSTEKENDYQLSSLSPT